MVQSEVVTLGPRINITLTTGTVLKILEEYLGDSNAASTVKGKLTIGLQELLSVLLDKRCIVNSTLESIIL